MSRLHSPPRDDGSLQPRALDARFVDIISLVSANGYGVECAGCGYVSISTVWDEMLWRGIFKENARRGGAHLGGGSGAGAC